MLLGDICLYASYLASYSLALKAGFNIISSYSELYQIMLSFFCVLFCIFFTLKFSSG